MVNIITWNGTSNNVLWYDEKLIESIRHELTNEYIRYGK
jgi:hypothetical protein